MVVELLLIFDDLDAKEYGAETERGDEKETDQLLLAHLCRPDSHCHGQAAQDEYDRVAAAEFQVQRVAAGAEGGAECVAVNGVDQEEPAEEQDFGDQEDPHAKRSSFLLLLKRFEVSVQFAGAVHSVLLFLKQFLAWLRPTTGRTGVRPYI